MPQCGQLALNLHRLILPLIGIRQIRPFRKFETQQGGPAECLHIFLLQGNGFYGIRIFYFLQADFSLDLLIRFAVGQGKCLCLFQ